VAVVLGGVWTSVKVFWDDNSGQPGTQRIMLIAAAIATAALILAIGYLLASDVRGRAQAMVATINARADVARAVIEVAHGDFPPSTTDSRTFVPVAPRGVRYTAVASENELNWTLLAMSTKDDGTDPKLFISKDSTSLWVPSDQVVFLTTDPSND